MPAASKVSVGPPSEVETVADTPVTVACEVLATVIAHPPSVPALTWFWSGGVVEGTWKLGELVGGLTVVESRTAMSWGAAQVNWKVVGVPWIT